VINGHHVALSIEFAADHADKDFSAIIEMLRNG